MSDLPADLTLSDEFANTSDEEFQDEQDAWEKFVERGLSKEFLSQFEGAQKQLQTWNQDTTQSILQDEVFDNAETYYQPVQESVPAADTTYSEQQSITEAQKDAIAEQPRPERSRMRQRIVLILLGVAAVDALVFYLLQIQHAQVPAPSSKGPRSFTQADADSAEILLDHWRSEDDADMWASIATYVDQAHASLQSQLVMMGYIKNWVAADPINWGPSEKSDAIQALVKAAATDVGNMYRTVAGMQHNAAPLQRTIAADLCEHALAQMLAAAQVSATA